MFEIHRGWETDIVYVVVGKPLNSFGQDTDCILITSEQEFVSSADKSNNSIHAFLATPSILWSRVQLSVCSNYLEPVRMFFHLMSMHHELFIFWMTNIWYIFHFSSFLPREFIFREEIIKMVGFNAKPGYFFCHFVKSLDQGVGNVFFRALSHQLHLLSNLCQKSGLTITRVAYRWRYRDWVVSVRTSCYKS